MGAAGRTVKADSWATRPASAPAARGERSRIENPSVSIPQHRRRWLVPTAPTRAPALARGARAARLRRRLHGAAAACVPARRDRPGKRSRVASSARDDARLGARDARVGASATASPPDAAARRRAADGRDRRRLAGRSFWPLSSSPSSARSTRVGRHQRLPAARARALAHARKAAHGSPVRTLQRHRRAVRSLGALAGPARRVARIGVAPLRTRCGDVRRLCAIGLAAGCFTAPARRSRRPPPATSAARSGAVDARSSSASRRCSA